MTQEAVPRVGGDFHAAPYTADVLDDAAAEPVTGAVFADAAAVVAAEGAVVDDDATVERAAAGLRRPSVDKHLAEQIAHERFALVAVASELGSNQDRNFLLSRAGRPVAVLKIDNAAFTRDELRAQIRATQAFAAAGIPTARFNPGLDGDPLQSVVDLDGIPHEARLMEFVPGGSLVEEGYLGAEALHGMGELAARVDLALENLTGPGLDRDLQWDLRNGIEVVRSLAEAVTDETLRERVVLAAEAAWAAVEPLAAGLPVQPIHSDLTDDNVVARKGPDGRGRARAVIDLGDLAEGWRVAELAVTLSSLLHHRPDDPLQVLRAATAYAQRAGMSQAEATALWPLVVLRAAVLVVSGWEQTRLEEDNEYAAERIAGEQAIFDAATAVPLAVGVQAARVAVGMPDEREAPTWLRGASLWRGDGPSWGVIDVGVESEALDAGEWLEVGTEEALAELALEGGELDAVALAAFVPRLTAASIDDAVGAPTLPLGVSLFASKTLAMVAPVDGTAIPGPAWVEDPEPGADPTPADVDGPRPVLRGIGEGAADTDGEAAASGACDVVLETETGERLVVRGLVRPVRWGEVARGTVLGYVPVGARVEVFLARAGAPEDLPSLVPAAQGEAWRALLLDPSPLLGLRPTAQVTSPAVELARRTLVQSSAQEKYYARPPQIERGWRHHLVDTTGRARVDLVNNVAGLGHSHPAVREAANRALGLLNTNSRFLYRSLAEYAQRLADLAPDGLDTVLFVNSGSEAVDLALKVARAATGRRDVVALREAYHGWTFGADAVTTSAYDSPHALSGLPEWVHLLPVPHPLRGAYSGEDAPRLYAREAADILEDWAAQGMDAGAFIAESVLGNAGGVLLPEGYLRSVYAAVRSRGGLCIADEVQVGFGRMGEAFWGFELQGVVPDVITIAKPMGNGFPIGAVITRRELAEALGREGMFFSSAGGSPLSCAVGMAVLDAMEEEDLQGNALRVGARLKAGLQGLVEKHPMAAFVHGTGLYLGLELVRSPDTLEPAAEETAAICERLAELGVIVQPTSERQNVLKIKPPLCLSEASADFAVAQIDRVLTEGW